LYSTLALNGVTQIYPDSFIIEFRYYLEHGMLSLVKSSHTRAFTK